MTNILDKFPLLTAGKHRSPEHGACVMEAVAFVAGEPWSDHPKCACPVLAAFARSLNDRNWPTDKDRTDALAPLVPLLVGTRNPALESARRWFFADAAVRQFAPLAFEKRWPEYAAKLRALPRVTAENWKEAQAVCEEAKKTARAAAAAYAAAATTAAAVAAAAAATAAVAAAACRCAVTCAATTAAARLRVLRLVADVLRQAIELKETS